MDDLSKRKLQRLKNYDYSHNGAYFITTCTYKRLDLFGIIIDAQITLNPAGEMISNTLAQMAKFYSNIIIDKYVVMPNHVHAIVLLENRGTPQRAFPTTSIPDCMNRFKTITTKFYIDGVKKGIYRPFDKHIWQKSFHDHIIRNEQEYQKIWEYIDTNPLKWELDKYNEFAYSHL